MTLAVAGIVVATVFSGDLLVGASLGTLLLGYVLLDVDDRVPVLFAAFTFQWIQICSGFYYTLITGRMLEATYASDYRTMMYLGLGMIAALAAGIRAGIAAAARATTVHPVDRPVCRTTTLVMAYAASLGTTATIQALAWEYPVLTQPIIALTFARLALLYLLLRRFAIPEFRLVPFAAVVAIEVLLGLTAFFAVFREPLVLALLVLFEAFDRRRVLHWVVAALLLAAGGALGLMWLGVRGEYRRDFIDAELFAESREVRLARLQELTEGWWNQDPQEFWWNLDLLVERLWAIYYPALAVARVPSTVAHSEGELMMNALRHVLTPRILFPDKPELPSDSELVRHYAGIWVAGPDQGTSIAFGYAAESYVDFGVPGMFVPAFLWGLVVGGAYRMLQVLIRHTEISTPILAVIFWVGLYLFERSWAKMIGSTGTMLIYLGGAAILVDRVLLAVAARRDAAEAQDAGDTAPGVTTAAPARAEAAQAGGAMRGAGPMEA
jgi:hypothetical protein